MNLPSFSPLVFILCNYSVPFPQLSNLRRVDDSVIQSCLQQRKNSCMTVGKQNHRSTLASIDKPRK